MVFERLYSSINRIVPVQAKIGSYDAIFALIDMGVSSKIESGLF